MFGEREQGHVLEAGLQDFRISLIRYEHEVALRCEFGESRQVISPVDHAGGIVRVVDENEARARGNGVADCLYIDLIIRVVRHGDGDGAELQRDVGVERKRGIHEDGLIARVQERRHDGVDARTRPVGRDDGVWRVFRVRLALDVLADGFQKLGVALSGRVAREALVHRLLGGIP